MTVATGGDPEVERMAARLRLVADNRRTLGIGAMLSRGVGSSLEFHDHREYQPGDDPRHLDMAAWARTGRPVVRRQRAETSPRVEILIDDSASMAFTPAKTRLAAQVAGLWLRLAEHSGCRPQAWLLGERAQPLRPWRNGLAGYAPAAATMQPPHDLLPGSERVLISDGLTPDGAAIAVRKLGDGAARFHLIQILTRDEREPTQRGSVRCVDAERGSNAGVDLDLDDAAHVAYRQRLNRLIDEWKSSVRGRGQVLTATVEDGLESVVRRGVAAGLLAWKAGVA